MALYIKILFLKEKLKKLLHCNSELGLGGVECLFASLGIKLIVFFYLW